MILWSRQDFHSRSYATLATRRSVVMGEALKIADPATSTRCTSCHAPFHDLPPARRMSDLDHRIGVSCESCHGPAEPWLRSHTRADFSHADRVAAGMRDLQNLYVRANTCVACHQNIDSELLQVGHPELIFELDGQAVTQPKHWREAPGWQGPQAWLVGQAVALREISGRLAQQPTTDENVIAQWRSLIWLLQQAASIADLPSLVGLAADPTHENISQVQRLSDRLARRAASLRWSPDLTAKCLNRLASTSEDFTDTTVSQSAQARRAERLVLGLDRLWIALDISQRNSHVEAELNELLRAVQSLPDFKPAEFAARLGRFKQKLQPAASVP